ENRQHRRGSHVLKRDLRCRGGAGDANHIGIAASIQEELLDGVTDFAVLAQVPKRPLVIAEVRDAHGLVDGPARRVPDKRGNRSRNPGYGVDTAGNLFYVHTGVRWRNRHLVSLGRLRAVGLTRRHPEWFHSALHSGAPTLAADWKI